MRLFLGIDGGGTKTEALVCNEDGIILGRGIAGPSNPLFIGKLEAFKTINEIINVAVANFDRKVLFDSAAVCIPGIKKYRDEIEIPFLLERKNAYIDADELNAFYGAVAKPYGIVVVSGTGSFAMGINRKGESIELGGWGPLLGDEGSGYYIGILCLKAVINEYERAGPKTALTPKVKEFLGINDVSEMRRAVYSKEFDRSSIAKLSKIVRDSADLGDTVSIEIVNNTAEQLADLVKRVVCRLNMSDGEYDAVLTGGVSNFGELLIKPFTAIIKEKYANIRVRKPEFRPSVGSLLIAMKNTGIDINNREIMENLRDSYKNIENLL